VSNVGGGARARSIAGMLQGPPGDDVALIERLRAQVVAAVDEAVPADEPVALVNFPNHANAGDPALWLAAREVLLGLGRRLAYQCAWSSYDADALRAACPEGTIVLNGGGNLGDAYAGQQGTREQVLADFPGRRVVQLPQSTWFRHDENLERVQRLIEEHGAFTLMLRDEPSLAFAREHLSGAVAIHRVPDMVFALGPQDRAAEPTTPVLWLARHDPETPDAGNPELDGPAPGAEPAGVQRVDWLVPVAGEPEPPTSFKVARRAFRSLGGDEPVRSRLGAGVLARTFEPLARYWTERGKAILSRGEVVVTDRLHGHVLCLLMGIPHVVTDNRTGKVRAVWDADTHTSTVARWADSRAAALDLALDLAGAR
jgi:exopolysaccharide biosynthesis predicted pyruvyltransferase EpsI